MKNIIIKNGLIASVLVVLFMTITTYLWKTNDNFKPSAIYGFGGMIIAFSFIFIGIKNFRDKENNGIITFGKAFLIGFWISLMASLFYVVCWMILYYNFIPNFMDLYSESIVEEAKKAGDTAAQIQAKLDEVKGFQEMYKNPIMVFLLTLLEIFPVGLIVSLISALLLKRKAQTS